MYHIVTYATHAHGLFHTLVNNPYAPVVVLGWGTPWHGFSDKTHALLAFLNTVDNDDVVVFVDGWDSIVNKDPAQIETLFKRRRCDILVSKDNSTRSKVVFGTCHQNTTANAGMFMGRVQQLRILLREMASMRCTDDQVNLNKMCSSSVVKICIDHEGTIFQNTATDSATLHGIFVSYPGTSQGRHTRVIREYSQYFVRAYMLIMLTLVLLLPHHAPCLLAITFALLFLQISYSDNSCVC